MARRSVAILFLVVALVGCAAAAPPAAHAPTSGPTATATADVTPRPAATVAAAELTVAPTAAATTAPAATATATTALQMRRVTPFAPDGAPRYQVVGFSTNGHAIEAFQLGDGAREVIFIGGIHGGYEWNTILLAYQVVDYFAAFPDELPPDVTLTIIPAANPDGQMMVTGRRGRFAPEDVGVDTASGRFNGNGVDLNRNWDCEWAATGWWRDRPVSGGSAPFSEVENQVLRDYILERTPHLVVFWHSAAPGVFLGNCGGQYPAQTETWGAAYAAAAGYPMDDTFEAYVITGDASNYLVSRGIPSFAVELTTHQNTDLDRNLAGMRALFSFFR